MYFCDCFIEKSLVHVCENYAQGRLVCIQPLIASLWKLRPYFSLAIIHNFGALSYRCTLIIKRSRENGAPAAALPSTITAMTTLQRVAALRELMRQLRLYAFVIPTEDAHMSEYVASCDERRAFITGFTGSAGTAVVTLDGAYCWTDGRYFVQASKELDPNVFTMMRVHEDPPIEVWIAENFPETSVVGIDGKTVSVASMKRFRTAAAAVGKRMISIICLPSSVTNVVDQVWSTARPAIPASTIFVHPICYAGRTVHEKLSEVREKIRDRGASLLVVTALDEVAWLLNLRASDVDYNPVFWAFVTVTLDEATLYVNSTRFSDGVADHLAKWEVSVQPYEALYTDLSSRAWDENDKLWVDPGSCNQAILDSVERSNASVTILKKQGPVALAKARKNNVELDGMRACHLRDGVAVCKFMCWLEKQIAADADLDEVSVATKLDSLRGEQDKFVSLSFPTISSAGANGAVIHYKPEKKTCSKVTANDMYLVDSGGQYHDGTTDITRTIHLGTPTSWQKGCFTRVLQGHIALDTAVFPKGTTGHLLDGFARRPLWGAGLDYKHGTGHGIGSFLNVHEGPHVISFKSQALETALEPGFFTSNEPGYYEEGAFGVRIENVCVIKEADVKGPPNGLEKSFMCLEHVTMVPMQAKLIDVNLLSAAERDWVDSYHEEIVQKLSPLLGEDSDTMSWLKENTKKLTAM